MDWFVIRHPESGGAGVVAESALPAHRGLGWVRVSDAVSEMDKDQLDLSAYDGAPDLDAPTGIDLSHVDAQPLLDDPEIQQRVTELPDAHFELKEN